MRNSVSHSYELLWSLWEPTCRGASDWRFRCGGRCCSSVQPSSSVLHDNTAEELREAWSRLTAPGSNLRKVMGWLVEVGSGSTVGYHVANSIRGEVTERRRVSEKRPIINFRDPDVQIGGLTRESNGDWTVYWGKRGQYARSNSMHVSQNMTGGSAGGGYTVHWSD